MKKKKLEGGWGGGRGTCPPLHLAVLAFLPLLLILVVVVFVVGVVVVVVVVVVGNNTKGVNKNLQTLEAPAPTLPRFFFGHRTTQKGHKKAFRHSRPAN